MKAATDIENYLAGVPAEYRAALEKLRRTIKAAAPEATEAISYQMPGFRAHGRALVTYAAFKDHYSFFPMSMAVIHAHEEELKPYISGKGTIRFHVDEPLPTALVKKIVQDRLKENAARERR